MTLETGVGSQEGTDGSVPASRGMEAPPTLEDEV